MHPESLRNIGILAHIDAGKTTLSERFLFYSGVERRLGEVHDGTTVMDWMVEERERGITITAAVTTCPWQSHFIQLIDTPGHVDFTAEVARSLRVLDGAIVVLDGVAGPQAQTETVVRLARRRQLPQLLFVNKMDRPGADFEQAVECAVKCLHEGAVALQLPWGEGRDFRGVVDLVDMCLWTWSEEDQGQTLHKQPIPPADQERARAARSTLCAQAASLKDDWVNLFLESDDLPTEVLQQAIRVGTLEGVLVPVFCGAALRNMGVQPLLDAVVSYLPSPLERPVPQASDPATGVVFPVPPDSQAPLAAYCFKVVHEEHGDLVYLRIFAGTLRPGDSLINVRTGHREKLQSLYAMHAEHRDKRTQVGPGGLLAVPGLPRVQTGDTLCAAERVLHLAPILFPEPVMQQAVEARDSSSHARLGHSLAILAREDPTLRVSEDEETGGYLLAGMGELHLEVAFHRLQREFGLKMHCGVPRVSFRETLRDAVQSCARLTIPGENSSFVEVRLGLEPQEEEICSFTLTPSCPSLAPELLQGLSQANLLSGWVGHEGYPMAQLRILLEDWSCSSERLPTLDFFLGAMQLAVSKAFSEKSIVLEPYMALVVEVPEVSLSGVLADLQKRSAQILEVEAVMDLRTIRARIPLSKMVNYSTSLRSLSQGRANFQMQREGWISHRGDAGADG